jgi:hypothetical protein
MDILEFLYDYFEDRAHAAALIRQRRPYALGLLGALFGGVSLFVFNALAGRLGLLSFSWPALLISLIWQVAFLFATTAVLHLLLDMTGARGDAGALFVHVGLSEVAWLAAAPAALIVQAFSDHAAWFTWLVFIAVWGWTLALKARGIRDEYGVGEGRAWVTLLLPAVVGMGLIGMTGLLTIIALVAKAFAS